MADIQDLQRRFPHFKIRSQPAPGCKCNDGVRKTKDGHEFPCLCVCMSAPEAGEAEYRPEVCKAVGGAAIKVAEAMAAKEDGR